MEKIRHSNVESRKELTLAEIYSDDSYITLYRYEKPETEYKESREGSVSKKEIVGQWFTKEISDLKAYIRGRKPGGILAVVRVLRKNLNEYDAQLRDETKDMDIEVGNFIVPPEAQQQSRIEVPLTIVSRLENKFSFSEYDAISKFVDHEMSQEALLLAASRKS
jgi:hypothetical protein